MPVPIVRAQCPLTVILPAESLRVGVREVNDIVGLKDMGDLSKCIQSIRCQWSGKCIPKETV